MAATCEKDHEVDKQLDSSKCKSSNNETSQVPEHPDADTKEKSKKQIPNYFVALQIKNPEIHEKIKSIQESVTEVDGRIKAACVSVEKLHFTLMVMKLNDEDPDSDEMERARSALESASIKLKEEYKDEKELKIDVTGVGAFGKQVVFAKLKEGISLDIVKYISEVVHKSYEDYNISTTDKKRSYKPHLTIFKMKNNSRKKGIRGITEQLYAEFKDKDFGSQKIETLQLCSMVKPKQDDGYYHIEHEVPIIP